MKKFIIPIFLCLAIQIGFAQKATNMSKLKVAPNGTMHYALMDNAPQLKDCASSEHAQHCTINTIKKFLITNLQNDASAKSYLKNAKQRTIYIRFIVNKSGNIENIGVRSQNAYLKSKIKKILAKLPQFTSGIHNGNVFKAAFNMYVDLSDAIVENPSKIKY